jgi:predicted nucleic acid-binding protein
MKAVLDSDVLIDYLQGLPQAAVEMERYKQPMYSVITFMELHCGAKTKEQSTAVDILLSTMTRVDLSDEIARRAVELRKELRLKLPDAIVLASAEVNACILVTRNTKDFPLSDARVRFPYAL